MQYDDLILRQAGEQDYAQLAEMKWLHCQEDDADDGESNLAGVDRAAFAGAFVAFLKNQTTYRIFIACDRDRVASAMFVGLIPKVPKPNRKSESIAYLTNVYTRKEYRGQGIGTKLLDHIKQQLMPQACELLFVWPSERAVPWYERCGFMQENELMECPLGEE